MSQFTLYKNENKDTRKTYPYFVDVQHKLLSSLNTRLVIPLSPHKTLKDTNAEKLCPVFQIEQGSYVLLTHQLTSIPLSALKTKVCSLENFRDDIIAAIDMLITGI